MIMKVTDGDDGFEAVPGDAPVDFGNAAFSRYRRQDRDLLAGFEWLVGETQDDFAPRIDVPESLLTLPQASGTRLRFSNLRVEA